MKLEEDWEEYKIWPLGWVSGTNEGKMADELTNGFKKAFALHKTPAVQASHNLPITSLNKVIQ